MKYEHEIPTKHACKLKKRVSVQHFLAVNWVSKVCLKNESGLTFLCG
jgi:hypothetical protein